MREPKPELQQEWQHLLEELNRLGTRPILFGGLGVEIQSAIAVAASAEESDESVRDWRDPRFLCRIVRGTNDIDLGFDGFQPSPRMALETLGFRQAQSESTRFLRDELRIDAIVASADPGASPLERLLHQLLPEAEFVAIGPGPSRHRVASPAWLVVLKAVAWRSRYEERDLTDVAHLAIADSAIGVIHERLLELMPRLDTSTRDALDLLGDAFKGQFGSGPRAFCKVVRESLGGRLIDDWEDDNGHDTVAGIASSAVKRLLRVTRQ